MPPAAERRRGDGLAGTGEPDGPRPPTDVAPRRHLPPRRRRPAREHRHRHAVGRLAAVVAADPGARILPRQPAADDLARCRHPPPRSGTRSASAHHPLAHPPASRRDPGRDARHAAAAISRISGSCVYLLRRLVGGYEPQQAIDAPMLPHGLARVVVRTARLGARRTRRRAPRRRRRRSPSSTTRSSRDRRRRTGRSGGSRWSAATRSPASCSRPPIRAAHRATRPDAESGVVGEAQVDAAVARVEPA